MRWYWSKIVIGALLVFGVGYSGYLVVRRLVSAGKIMVHSTNPITIPLKFVPFALAGDEIGTFQRVTFRRSAPDAVEGIDLRVQVKDSAVAEALRACRVTPAGVGNFDPSNGFRCLDQGTADSGLVLLGEVRVRGPEGLEFTIPLLVDSALFGQITGTGGSAVENTRSLLRADEAAAAAAMAEKAAVRATQKAESLSTAIRTRVKLEQGPATP
ncbi:MAG: hypothetical protein AAB075_09030 [Gemmatimonadota bacterium]